MLHTIGPGAGSHFNQVCSEIMLYPQTWFWSINKLMLSLYQDVNFIKGVLSIQGLVSIQDMQKTINARPEK